MQRMLKAGQVELASSMCANNVVLVPRPDGTLRFCVDYRNLNALITWETYQIPRMNECIESLGDAQIFTTLEFNSGYWQIPVAPEDIEKTKFTYHEGNFECCLDYGTRRRLSNFRVQSISSSLG
jgi:hypothetical protein